MFLRMIFDDELAQAAWLIGCQKTGEAIVIDPERDVDRYIEIARQNGLRIVAVAETHIHADFISGARELAETNGAKVYVSDEGDADWKYGWLDKKLGGGSYDHQLLHDGDVFDIGNIQFTVMHTPGHTPEHVAYLVTDKGSGAEVPIGVCSGDFVFVGDLGRPDLLETAAGFEGVKEASAHQLAKSARKFHELPDFVQVWPAHGAGSACGKALGAVPQSTVGYEKALNPALRLAGEEDRFVEFILEGQPEPPRYFARMKTENRDGPAVLGALPTPRELSADELNALPSDHVVVDTRPWPQVRDGALPGALFSPLGSNFHSFAGSYLEPQHSIVLVVEPSRVEDAVRSLVRIGFDHVVGWASPQSVAALASRPGALVQLPEVDVETLKTEMSSGQPAILDVRRLTEFQEGAIPGAQHIPHTRLATRLDEAPRQGPIYVHCRSGVRSAAATSLLNRLGHEAINVAGGFNAWKQAGGQVVIPESEAIA